MTTPMVCWHIPRTGGTSLRNSAAVAGIDIRSSEPWSDAPALVNYRHLTPCDAIDVGLVSREELLGVPNIIVVRNTWDRLVSLFCLFHYRGNPGLKEIATRLAPTFERYVLWCTEREPSEEPALNYHEVNFRCRSQLCWLDGLDQHIRIFDFGNLAAAWDVIANHFHTPSPLLHANRSPRKPYREYFAPDLRDRVADFYHEEISRFGFTF